MGNHIAKTVGQLKIPEAVPAIELMLAGLQKDIRTIQSKLEAAAMRKSVDNMEADAKWFHGATQAIRIKRAQEQKVRESLALAKKRERMTRSKTLAEHFMEVTRDSVSKEDFEDLLEQAAKRLPEYMKEGAQQE